MTSSDLFFTRGENWKLRNAPRAKNFVAFHPGNSETRHFCARYGSQDCWAATLVGSGQASNTGTRVPGFIQAMLAAGRWEPQSLIADTPQVPRNHREVSVNPTSCLTKRFSSALLFFFLCGFKQAAIREQRQQEGSARIPEQTHPQCKQPRLSPKPRGNPRTSQVDRDQGLGVCSADLYVDIADMGQEKGIKGES